jgi:hypothetical protein
MTLYIVIAMVIFFFAFFMNALGFFINMGKCVDGNDDAKVGGCFGMALNFICLLVNLGMVIWSIILLCR